MTIEYKFNEANLIDEFKKYIDSTYEGHYSVNKFQATEFVIDGGHGTGFCIGNVLKYAQRYGKKGTESDARKDLMKVLHYALIQLYIHDTKFGNMQSITFDNVARFDNVDSYIKVDLTDFNAEISGITSER